MSRPLRAEALSYTTGIRLTRAERRRALAAARVNRQRLSEFIRDAVVTAAEVCLVTRTDGRREETDDDLDRR
jgi:hypothetical protein